MTRISPALSLIVTADPTPGVIEKFLECYNQFTKEYQGKTELLIIDSLKTLSIERKNHLLSLDKSFSLNMLDPGLENRDQLKAILWAIKKTKGEAIITIDPDMYKNIMDIPRFINSLEQGSEIVYGRRVQRNGVPFWRKILSFFYNQFVRHTLKITIRDFNSPMVLITQKAIKDIPSNIMSPRVYLCMQYKEKTSEVSISTSEHNKKTSSYSFVSLILTGVNRVTEIIGHRKKT